MAKCSTLEKYREQLWQDLDTIAGITPVERSQILRYRFIFNEKLANPAISNVTIVSRLKGIHKIGDAQAYRDIGQVNKLLSNVNASNKAWARYLMEETLKEAINLARDKGEPETMAKAAGLIGKYNRLDQEDQEPPKWDEIVPLPVEFANDPQLMGIKIDNPHAFVEKIKGKYLVEDVQFEEVKE